jgi:hypothetical protein
MNRARLKLRNAPYKVNFRYQTLNICDNLSLHIGKLNVIVQTCRNDLTGSFPDGLLFAT